MRDNKKKTSSFRGKVTTDVAKQKKDAQGFGILNLPKDVKTFSPKPDSRITFDVIPYRVSAQKHPDRNDQYQIATPDSIWYKRPFKVHRNIGADGETVVCLSSFGKKCPICEYLKTNSGKLTKEEYGSIKASLRNLYIVIPLDSKDHEVEPHVLDISQYNFQNKLNEEMGENEDYEMFPDLEEGFSLKVRWGSKTMGTGKPFAEASRIDFIDRKKPYDESIVDEVPCLDEVLKELTYDELHAKFFETEGETIGEVEETQEEETRPAASDRKRKSVEKEATEETDDEKDEKPARQRSAKKEPEPEPVPDMEWEDLENMSQSRLERYVEKNDLDIDIADYDDDVSALRKAIAKKLGVEVPKPAAKSASKPEPAAKSRPTAGGKNQCPFGHKFGVDTDETDDCGGCDKWDDCTDAKEANEK